MKKTICAVLAAALMLLQACCAAEGESEAYALRPALPSAVRAYQPDGETGGWREERTVRYRYDNGYPVEMAVTYPESNEIAVTFFEYEFSGDGLPVTMKQTVNGSSAVRTTQYRDGNVYEIRSDSGDGTTVMRTLLQYADKGPYFTLLFSYGSYRDPEGAGVPYTMEEADSISVTLTDGLMAKSVNTGLYANRNEGEEKEWMRFNGTYTAYYDGNGIVAGTASVFRAGPPGGEDVIELTVADGLVTEAVRSVRYPDGSEIVPAARYVFEYTDIETSPVRYANMINAYLLGEDNNYYKYFWY